MKKKSAAVDQSALEHCFDYPLDHCMDYLHGDIADGEFAAACTYEYARESKILLEAARLRARGKTLRETLWEVEQKYSCGSWFIEFQWRAIWSCPSFPKVAWNHLSRRHRAKIAAMGVFPLPAGSPLPLRMIEVSILETMGVLDELKSMAMNQTEFKDVVAAKTPPPVYPIIEGWPRQQQKSSKVVHALFTLDFTKTQKQMLEEFSAWLELPSNALRFETHERNPTGKTGVFKDRLKDLAAWRLYRKLRRDEAIEFARNHRLLDGAGLPRAFHDSRRPQAGKDALNEAELFSDESGFKRAQARALAYRAELLTWEFGEEANEERKRRQADEARDKAVFKGLKISKSSS